MRHVPDQPVGERAFGRDTEWHDHGLVFAQENGRPIDPSADYAAWGRLLVAAGVRPARLHDARHTGATVMRTLGVPDRVRPTRA
jgi:integrase